MAIIDIIAGTRPNFVKVAPIIRGFQKNTKGSSLNFRLVHTGQHYSKGLSQDFFEQLEIPEPNINLGTGSGSHAEQTAKIMIAYENLLKHSPCDVCLVVGDVNSTLSCAIVAKKLQIPVGHVEAGLRSWDQTMPEEINRIITDSIADLLFTTSVTAGENLENQGIGKDKIFFVGNTMIDTLIWSKSRLLKPKFWDSLGLVNGDYLVFTAHRPSNVDKYEKFIDLLVFIAKSVGSTKIIYPVHPRIKAELLQKEELPQNVYLFDPFTYFELGFLVKNAKGVITDSGGVSEETTIYNTPCITLRDTTERPETVLLGTNELVGQDKEKISLALERILSGNWKTGVPPKFWDGHAADRIVSILESKFV